MKCTPKVRQYDILKITLGVKLFTQSTVPVSCVSSENLGQIIKLSIYFRIVSPRIIM